MSNESSFESINAHIEKANLSDYQPGGKLFRKEGIAAESAGDILIKVCGIFKIVRPILVGLTLIPFIPKKWKEALNTFIGFMDSLCP